VVQDVTRARLDRLLVTGQVTVELEGYEPKARTLTPGARIEPKADPINSLTKSLPEVFNEITALVNGLQETVSRLNGFFDHDNQARVSAILEHLEHGSATLPEQLGKTLNGMDGLLVELHATVAKLDRVAGGLTDSAGGDAGSLVAQARAGLAGLQHVTDEFGALAREAHGMIGGVRAPTVAMLASLRATLDEVRGLARLLRLAPNSLLYGLDRRAEDAAMPPPGGGR